MNFLFFISFCGNGEKNENLEFKIFAKYELIVKIQKILRDCIYMK